MLLPYRCGASMQERQVHLVFNFLYVPASGVVLAGLNMVVSYLHYNWNQHWNSRSNKVSSNAGNTMQMEASTSDLVLRVINSAKSACFAVTISSVLFDSFVLYDVQSLAVCVLLKVCSQCVATGVIAKSVTPSLTRFAFSCSIYFLRFGHQKSGTWRSKYFRNQVSV